MTTPSHPDETIREALAELRAMDERTAPPFEDVVTRVATGRDSQRIRRIPIAVAAGILLAVSLAYPVWERSHRLLVPREVAILASWRPPTDMLLYTHVTQLLAGTPKLGESLIDHALTGELP
jgi:hypothetical protein